MVEAERQGNARLFRLVYACILMFTRLKNDALAYQIEIAFLDTMNKSPAFP